jgi:hypothetical protein
MFINNNDKNNNNSKTVFSKVTKDVMNKYNEKFCRFNYFNKDLAYSMMINDYYLYRISDKQNNKEEIAQKNKDFIERTNELNERKQLKIQAITENHNKEMSTIYTGMPEVNVKLEQLRSPDVFFSDQIKFKEITQNKIEENKKKISENVQKTLRDKPEISMNSKEIAKKKNSLKGQELYSRLAKDSHNAETKHYMNQQKMKEKRLMDLKVQKNYTAIFATMNPGLPPKVLVKIILF